jgi:uncharacterized protein DUF481
MTKVFLTAALIGLMAGGAFAEDAKPLEGWAKTADLGLIINQAGYSDSWAGDELGTFNWTFNANGTADRHLSASTLWTNQLKITYGKTSNEERNEVTGGKSWSDSEKSTDRIFLESLLKFQEGNYINPFFAVTYETQFKDDADNMFNPGRLTESAGVGRDLIKNDATHVFTRVGLAYRQYMVKDADTVTDGGLEWVTDATHTFNEQLKGVSKLRVFKAFTSSADDDMPDSDPRIDDWKTVDVAWEVNLSASVTKYLQTTVFFEVLYDKEIADDARWRDILGIGVTYKLF